MEHFPRQDKAFIERHQTLYAHGIQFAAKIQIPLCLVSVQFLVLANAGWTRMFKAFSFMDERKPDPSV
jgi:hypothetical protein